MAVSLGNLRQLQGRGEEGRALLNEVREWFTEGHEGVDLKEAGRLLENSG